jgi:hypothetical protein
LEIKPANIAVIYAVAGVRADVEVIFAIVT